MPSRWSGGPQLPAARFELGRVHVHLVVAGVNEGDVAWNCRMMVFYKLHGVWLN